MSEGLFVVKFVLIALKAFSALVSLLLFFAVAGWMGGADNLAFPGLGLIVATPVLITLLAIAEIGVMIAFMILSALAS